MQLLPLNRAAGGRLLGLLFLLAACAPAGATGKMTVGEEIDRRFESPHPYQGESRLQPAVVWSVTLHHPGATYITPHFEQFDLADGDFVLVRSPDGERVRRYEGRGKSLLPPTREGFWSGHVKGDTAIVELYSRHALGSFGLTIDRYARGFTDKEIDTANGGAARSICGDDDTSWAPCYAGTEPEIYEQSRAVARLLIEGVGSCTGWLVGCEGHLMTNNHCIEDAVAAANTDYEFMAEGVDCSSNCVGVGACPGIVEADQATLIQTDPDLDYSLLLLPTDVSSTYGFLRMRDTDPVVDERMYIPQHAAGWGKRIAVSSTHPQDASGFCEIHSLDEAPCYGGEFDVGYFADTQEGSSGSPVIAYDDHRVVALHHCAACANRGVSSADLIAALGANLPDCSLLVLAGTINLDRTLYSCADLVSVRVLDDSLRGSGSATVSVASSTETTPEVLLLLEDPPLSGIFRGDLLTTAGPAAADGRLSLADGDTLTAEYIDADDGAGGVNVVRQALATADCRAPSISGVAATEISGSRVTIQWQTDEPADSRVDHGLAPGGTDSVTEPDLITDHGLDLAQLAECSTHYYSVTSADLAGNTTTDDNAGSYFTFVTGRDNRPEFSSTDTPLSIPDAEVSGVISTITVPDDETVVDVDVLLNITHSFDSDLTLSLIPPVGAAVTLSSRRGGDGDDFIDTLFDDEAATPIVLGTAPFTGAFQPDSPLSVIDGNSSAGDWQLKVRDHATGDVGDVESWTLILSYPAQVCGANATLIDRTLEEESCVAGSPGAGNGYWDAGELLRFSMTLENDGTVPLTGITTVIRSLGSGLTVLDDSASFPDLQPGDSAKSDAPHFTVRPASGLSCGTQKSFMVTVTSNEGSWMSSFQQRLGEIFPSTWSVLDEDFSAGIPPGWSVVDGLADGNTWFGDDPGDPLSCVNPDPNPPMGGVWAAVDSNCAGPLLELDEELISPQLSLVGAQTVTLEFDHYFDRFQSELAEVDVRSVLTGGTWVNVARWTADTPNPEHVTLDLTAHAAGAANLEVRWRYHSAVFDQFWYVDNVTVSGSAVGGCNMTSCSFSPAGPPAVPDGAGASQPLVASKLDPQGAQLRIAWDDSCTAATAKIVYGPLEQVGSYTVDGAVCAVTSPQAWQPPAGDLWFLVIHEDAAGREGAWGDGAGGERNGLAASGTCSSGQKDPYGVCP